MLVGEEVLDHFRNSTVAVIGVGGVGGYAAEMVVRAGVGHLIIMDSDDVSQTRIVSCWLWTQLSENLNVKFLQLD